MAGCGKKFRQSKPCPKIFQEKAGALIFTFLPMAVLFTDRTADTTALPFSIDTRAVFLNQVVKFALESVASNWPNNACQIFSVFIVKHNTVIQLLMLLDFQGAL